MTSNIRNLSRLLWIQVALPPTDEQPAHAKGKTPVTEITETQLRRRKVEALRLCLSFAFSVKHYLRGEDGVQWDDYRGVLPASFIRADEIGHNTQRTTVAGSYAATRDHSTAPSLNGSSEVLKPDATKRVRPKRSKTQVTQYSPLLSGTQATVDFHAFSDETSMPLPLVSVFPRSCCFSAEPESRSIAHEITRMLFKFRRDGLLETVGPAGEFFCDFNNLFKLNLSSGTNAMTQL